MAAVTVTSATALWFSLLSLANANVHLGAPQVGEGKKPRIFNTQLLFLNMKSDLTVYPSLRKNINTFLSLPTTTNTSSCWSDYTFCLGGMG